MNPATAEIDLDAPRSQAFEAIVDLARRPSFTAHFISGFHLTRIQSQGVGAGARFRLQLPPRTLWMDTTIVDVEEPHRVVEQGCGGRANRIPSTTVWELLEGPGSLTTVRVSYWTEPQHPFDRMLETLGGASLWYERAWRLALRKLRDQLESATPAVERIGIAGGNPHATGVP
jgi:uncharacterized protein YndB with AHSA1/START domain